jgi:hypothetical protein
MERLAVECLCCGQRRVLAARRRVVDNAECPRCGYLGWAPSKDLTERARGLLRRRAPEQRHLRIV